MNSSRPPIGGFDLPRRTIEFYQQLYGSCDGTEIKIPLAELCRRLGTSLATTQKHVARLEQAGALKVIRDGKKACTYQMIASDHAEFDDEDDEIVQISGALVMYGLSVRASALRMPISVGALGCYMRLLDLDAVNDHDRFRMTLEELNALFGLEDSKLTRELLIELWAVDMIDLELVEDNRAVLVTVDTAPELSFAEARRRLIDLRTMGETGE